MYIFLFFFFTHGSKDGFCAIKTGALGKAIKYAWIFTKAYGGKRAFESIRGYAETMIAFWGLFYRDRTSPCGLMKTKLP